MLSVKAEQAAFSVRRNKKQEQRDNPLFLPWSILLSHQ
ncbi:hypothetical protein ymoll0001_24730 [Yersinia mollaretii ATCC 43969]|uniref:Uncharacterized protein n=1 Tax=Yersinia mollaretii (strain ATCC 43969 / DSM 18520 / CIP 103324 / CNY 7263 / WAIP 204) TaxID=349967 RepID=A0ABM9YDR0_YERMW|nr:hypothetical protein ymoll0001_24730 [Yersinia mollaretii ATCC 43969]